MGFSRLLTHPRTLLTEDSAIAVLREAMGLHVSEMNLNSILDACHTLVTCSTKSPIYATYVASLTDASPMFYQYILRTHLSQNYVRCCGIKIPRKPNPRVKYNIDLLLGEA